MVAQLAVSLGSFLKEFRNVNEENCWKPYREIKGNQQPSPKRNRRKGSETIPKGSRSRKRTKHLASDSSFLNWDDDIVHPLWKHWDNV